MNTERAAPRILPHRYALEVLQAQLRQGITPHKLALTLALGFTLGVFPIMGSTTALCALAGVVLRLNQPIIQLVNYVAWPLQVPGIYLFIRIGERLTNAPAVSFSISLLLQDFRAAPLQFLARWGTTGLRGILAWCLIAPLIGLLLYGGSLPILNLLSRRLRTARPAA